LEDIGYWRSIQRARLDAELEWARRAPFFGRRLRGAGGRDALAALSAIAPFRKADAMAAGDALCVPGVTVVREFLTSGTTGRGQERLRMSAVDDATLLFGHVLQYQMAGLRSGDGVALTWPASCQAGGVVLRAAAELLGLHPVEIGTYDTAMKITVLGKLRPRAIVGSALYLRRLLEAAGPDDFGLDTCFVAGEAYPESWVRFVTDHGVRPFEWYGTTMLGPVAMSCEAGVIHDGCRGALHVAPHMFVVEVLDDEGRQVAAGERGELVVTALTRVAQPTIRYATGDTVRWLGWHRCGCGRAWPSLEAGTIARIDDMLRIRGVNVWPGAIEAELFAHADVCDYRGRLWVDTDGHERVDLTVEIRPCPADAEGFARQLRQALKDRTGCTFDVLLTSDQPEVRAFKPRRWTDERFAEETASGRHS
jgi:phenylacetate-CoA ligase